MNNEITINVIGNAVSDPERRLTAGGIPVTSFRFACNSRRWDPVAGRSVDNPSSYYTVTCWRQLADNVAGSIVKGQPVVVQGFLKRRVHVRSDGQKITYDDIEARSVGHDLSRGVARFSRTPRGPQLEQAASFENPVERAHDLPVAAAAGAAA